VFVPGLGKTLTVFGEQCYALKMSERRIMISGIPASTQLCIYSFFRRMFNAFVSRFTFPPTHLRHLPPFCYAMPTCRFYAAAGNIFLFHQIKNNAVQYGTD